MDAGKGTFWTEKPTFVPKSSIFSWKDTFSAPILSILIRLPVFINNNFIMKGAQFCRKMYLALYLLNKCTFLTLSRQALTPHPSSQQGPPFLCNRIIWLVNQLGRLQSTWLYIVMHSWEKNCVYSRGGQRKTLAKANVNRYEETSGGIIQVGWLGQEKNPKTRLNAA
jgi:hypothetical protein